MIDDEDERLIAFEDLKKQATKGGGGNFSCRWIKSTLKQILGVNKNININK
jgi:hypothetical protein